MKQLQFLSGLGIAGVVTVLAATPAKADVAQVTGVRLQQTPNGLQVILETKGNQPLQTFTASSGRTFIADIVTTQLRLREGNAFRQDNPAPGIASVTVTPLDANSVRVKVISTAGQPTAQVLPRARGVILSFSAAPGTTATLPTSPTGRPGAVTPSIPSTGPTDTPGAVTPSVPPTGPTDTPGAVTPSVPPTGPTDPSGAPTLPTLPTPPSDRPGAVVRPSDRPGVTTRPAPPTRATTPIPGNEPTEIIVTADPEGYRVPETTTGTRTDTPTRDVPQSIQVVPEQLLEDRRVNRLEDAVRSVSGVNPTTSSIGSFDQYNIRGFETSTTNILRNGQRDSVSAQVPNEFANVERVEVLKGPASVLYGQGSPGGVINIVTKTPLPDPFYDIELTLGNYNFYRGAIDLTGPLNSDRSLAYRFNFSYQNSGTFVDFADTERLLAAPSVSWDISDRTRVTFQGEIIRSSVPNYRGLPAIGTVQRNPNGRIPIERNIAEPGRDIFDNRVERIGYNLEHRFSENWSLRNAFRFTLFSYDQDSFFPSGLEPDGRTLNRGYTTGTSSTDTEILTTDLVGNFSTGPIAHKLLVGFELFRENLFKNRFDIGDIAPLDLFNPVYGAQNGPVTFRIDNATLTQSAGFYIQDQITLLRNLKLLVGGRFDLYEQKQKDELADTETDQSGEKFNPRVGIVYQPIEPISLYFSYSRSFNPVSGAGFDNRLFEPETGTQYEAGVKADLLDGRLSATLAFFNLTRQNVLTPDPRDANFSIQTGEQRSRGFELDVAGEILPGLRVIASYAYIDARITKDNAFEEGNRIEEVPENSASLWTTYEIQNGALRGLGFGLGLFYIGDRYGDLDNSFTLPSYVRTDAVAYYRRGSFRAALNVKNLFDIRYYEATDGPERVFPGAPLTIQGTIGLEF